VTWTFHSATAVVAAATVITGASHSEATTQVQTSPSLCLRDGYAPLPEASCEIILRVTPEPSLEVAFVRTINLGSEVMAVPMAVIKAASVVVALTKAAAVQLSKYIGHWARAAWKY